MPKLAVEASANVPCKLEIDLTTTSKYVDEMLETKKRVTNSSGGSCKQLAEFDAAAAELLRVVLMLAIKLLSEATTTSEAPGNKTLPVIVSYLEPASQVQRGLLLNYVRGRGQASGAGGAGGDSVSCVGACFCECERAYGGDENSGEKNVDIILKATPAACKSVLGGL